MDNFFQYARPVLGEVLRSPLWQTDVARIFASFVLIYLVLILLSAIYRGGAGDEEIEKPVTLAILNNSEENTLVLAPRHLREKNTHDSKAPKIEFFLQVPGCQKYDYKVLTKPLRLSIRGRNSSSVYDHEYARDGVAKPSAGKAAEGGQLGIDSETRNLLEKYFEGLQRKEGRRFDADTATFVVRLKYPHSINLMYLLRDHPDVGVRTGAWIFILTSIFSVVQELLFR